jgi:serine/threonine protein kinase/tetratricopeptide (TPR) repeat protein
MNPEQWRRVKDLFSATLHIPPERRVAFLEDTCEEDPEVRAEIEKLMWEQEQESDFLNTVTLAQRRKLLAPDRSTWAAGQMVADRYRIERFIRAGGMGEVYEAFDTMLQQRVALKTIRAGLEGGVRNLDRFKQEIALAREVTHANVCRVFDVAQHSDPETGARMLLLTMEFVPGRTLADRIKECGRMTPEEALPLVRQMASALAAAHDRKIVHCDFKPANVMLAPAPGASSEAGERAVVTDFGLALRLPLESADQETLPAEESVVGTPPYMAPEQFRPGSRLTGATDIYAFGLVLYEMVTGQRAFRGVSVQGQALERLHGTPEAPRKLAPDLPAVWEKTILRCLERAPEKRYGNTREILLDLEPPAAAIRPRFRRPAAVAGLLLLAALAAVVSRPWWPNRSEKHLAVLPLKAIGTNPALQVFSDGLTETLTSRLSQFQQLERRVWVVPASEVRSAKIGSVADCRRSFGVNLVMTGSVQETAGVLRVALNLVDAISLRQIASRSIELPSSQAALLEDTVTGDTAEILQITLSAEARKQFQDGMTQNPGAYRLYEQGMGYLRRFGRDNLDQAIAQFHRALDLDSRYALAYARLGEAYERRYETFTKDTNDAALARSNGVRAASLAPNLPAVQVTMGMVENTGGEYDRAVEFYRRALQSDPTSGEALAGLAGAYERLGKSGMAETTYKQAIMARPDFWWPYNRAGIFYMRAGRHEQAERMFATVAALIPDATLGHENQGALAFLLGRYDEAEKAFRRAIAIQPSSAAYSNLGFCFFERRQYRAAVPWFEKATELQQGDDKLWRNVGDAYGRVPELHSKSAPAYETAIKLAEGRLALNPRSADALTALALYCAKSGDRAHALTNARRANGLPLSSDMYLRLADTYEILGDRDQALKSIAAGMASGLRPKQIEQDLDLERLTADPGYRQLLSKQGAK